MPLLDDRAIRSLIANRRGVWARWSIPLLEHCAIGVNDREMCAVAPASQLRIGIEPELHLLELLAGSEHRQVVLVAVRWQIVKPEFSGIVCHPVGGIGGKLLCACRDAKQQEHDCD